MAMQEHTTARWTGKQVQRRARRGRSLLIWLSLVFLALPAHAIDSKKSAKALAQQAAKAFETGDMDRAAQAYLEAWHTDPSEPNYLYGAARAEQSAGQRDRAEEHYRQFVEMPTAEPARVAKAKGYLTEFDGVHADEKGQAGDRAAKRNEWRVAEAAYGEAWRLRPDRLPLLLKAARAADEGGDRKQSETWLREYLSRAPADAPDRAEAQAMLDARAGKRVVVASVERAPESPKPVALKPVAPPLPPPPVQRVEQPQPQTSARRTAGWWTLGTGAAFAVTGAALVILGKSAEAQFNQDLNYDGTVVHGSLTYEQATSRAQWIGSLQTTGVAFIGAGLAAAGVGAYLALTSNDAKVAMVPDWHGMALAGRF